MTHRVSVFVRKSHKWLGLFIGLQVVIWSLSGLYMTVVSIDIIHGNNLIRKTSPRMTDARSLKDPLALATANGAQNIRLAWVRNRPAYVLAGDPGEKVVDATSGAPVAPLTEAEIRSIAQATYTGNARIRSANLITQIPSEIRGRKPPLWRVEFASWNKATFYVSPTTGELISRRHELWRIFDFVWMMHIMDYQTRDNVNNTLLRVFTWGAVVMALSGAWMLIYAFPKKKKKKVARA